MDLLHQFLNAVNYVSTKDTNVTTKEVGIDLTISPDPNTFIYTTTNTNSWSYKADVKFAKGDWVAFSSNGEVKVGVVEDIYVIGEHEIWSGVKQQATSSNPLYSVRHMQFDNETSNYVVTNELTVVTAEGVKDFTPTTKFEKRESANNIEVGDFIYYKYADAYGEVVYRTEETFIIQEYDANGNLLEVRESYHIVRMYDNQVTTDEPEMYELSEKQEVAVYSFDDFMFIKAEDGSFKLYGIYSSHYIDTDGDILTSKSHKYFAENVNNGTFPYPDIYIAHMPVSVGKCEMIDYDDRGFAIFGGTVYKEWQDVVEEIVVKSIDKGIDLGLSHGFPVSSIEYDDEGFIAKYQALEVSILPINKEYIDENGNVVKMVSAANKYTALLAE